MRIHTTERNDRETLLNLQRIFSTIRWTGGKPACQYICGSRTDVRNSSFILDWSVIILSKYILIERRKHENYAAFSIGLYSGILLR